MSTQPFFAGVKKREDGKLILLSTPPKKTGKKRCAICGKEAKRNGVCSAEHYALWKENGFRKQ